MPAALVSALADRYRLERELGAGGMATVYLAHDLKHERDVAIKVLHPDLGAALGAERFLSEIKTTARLQHPHILPLLDSGAAEGFLYYVMPVVTGETLRARISRERQLPMGEAVRIAKEVASALDYAHRQGVVHRDIKPENILLHDGQALVADFGIALAVQSAGGARMTQTGLSLGTPQYMSPEQALGERTIDARSDIYALGAVTYEMITGDPPFTGSNVQAIVARLLNEKPTALRTLRDTVPAAVEQAVLTALAKLPADRFESARAFSDALVTTGGATVPLSTPVPTANPTANPTATPMSRPVAFASRFGGWILFAMAMTVALIEGVALSAAKRREAEAPTARFDLVPGEAPLVPGEEYVISPDGEMLAYVGGAGGQGTSIYLRRVHGTGEWRQLDESTLAGTPTFSPDGRYVAFRRFDDGRLYRVSVTEGARTEIPAQGQNNNPHWGTDDLIAVYGPGGSYLISLSGAAPRAMPVALEGRLHSVLPDGSGVLSRADGGVALWDIRTDSVRVLVPAGRHPIYVKSGHILYVGASGGLYAVGFDLKAHRVTTDPVRLLPRVSATASRRGFSVSDNGTLLYVDGEMFGLESGSLSHLVVIDPRGRTDTLPIPPSRQQLPRISPEGRRIAFVQSPNGNDGDLNLVVHDLDRGTTRQLTFAGEVVRPVWSPSGDRIAFGFDSARITRRIMMMPTDGSAPPTPIAATGRNQFPTDWPSATQLLYTSNQSVSASVSDIFVISPSAVGTPVAYSASPDHEALAQVSRDGRHAVFTRGLVGGSLVGLTVWIREFPNAVGQWQVARGTHPRWSADGKYVYYWRTGSPLDTLYRTPVEREAGVVFGVEERVLAIDAYGISNWDLFADGRILLTVVAVPADARGSEGGDPQTRYVIATTWFTELRALTAPRPR